MARFLEGDHAANLPPYLTLGWIPVHMNPCWARSHGRRNVIDTHLCPVYRIHTQIKLCQNKYIWKMTDPQLYPKWLSHGITPHCTSGPFINQNISHWSIELHVTQLRQAISIINACLIFATQIMVIRCYMTASNPCHIATQIITNIYASTYMHINVKSGGEFQQVKSNTVPFACNTVWGQIWFLNSTITGLDTNVVERGIGAVKMVSSVTIDIQSMIQSQQFMLWD